MADSQRRPIRRSLRLLLLGVPLIIYVAIGICAVVFWPWSPNIPDLVRFAFGFIGGAILWGLVYPVLGFLVSRKRR